MIIKGFFIGFHEFPNVSQGSLDIMAVVNDSLAEYQGQVARFRVAQEDVSRPIHEEEVGRPVRVVMTSFGSVGNVPALILSLSFCDRRKIVLATPDSSP